jgi:hypothetical protein
MSMTLKLDASALAALFPADSTARVELQRAVIAEVMRKTFLTDLDAPTRQHIVNEIVAQRRHYDEEVKKLVGLAFTREWGTFKIGDKDGMAEAIKTRARADFLALIDGQVASALKALTADGQIESRVQSVARRVYEAWETSIIKQKIEDVLARMKAAL